MHEQKLVFLKLIVYPPFPNRVIEATLCSLPYSVQHLRNLQSAIPCHFPTATSQPHFLGNQSISLHVSSILSMCLCPYTLATKKYYLVGSIYVLGSVTEQYISLLLSPIPSYPLIVPYTFSHLFYLLEPNNNQYLINRDIR